MEIHRSKSACGLYYSSMKKRLIGASVVLVVGLNGAVLLASSATATTSSKVVASQSTLSAIKGALWNKTVKITYSKTSATMEPNGIPNHKRDAYYAVPNAGVVVLTAKTASVEKDPTTAQNYKFTIPLDPKHSSTVTSTPMGSIGVMISGAVLFNPYEGDGKTVAMSSNFTITDSAGHTASFVDSCSGHPTPNQGAYHYHGLSSCITSKVDKPNGPSHIIGIALDGFPIYGARDINGKVISVKTLDKCNGISSPTPEFPKGIYHYVLPGTTDATSSIQCFHGVVDSSQIQQMPNMGNGPKP